MRLSLDRSAIVRARLVVWLLLGRRDGWPHQAVPPKPPSGIALSYEASPVSGSSADAGASGWSSEPFAMSRGRAEVEEIYLRIDR